MSRAAEAIGIQQPPLSLQIKALEASLGVQLFRRESRGLKLTEAGKTLLSESYTLLASLERAVEATRSVSRGDSGELRVGLAPTAPFIGFVPKSIRDFRNSYPDVRLSLKEGLSHEMRELLLTKLVDVAFVRNEALSASDIVVRRLLDEPMVLAIPAEHPASKEPTKHSLALADVADQPFVLVGPPGTGLHDAAVAACASAGFLPKSPQVAPQITSAIGLIAAGVGVALVPRSVQALRMEGVVFRPVSAPIQPTAYLGLAFRKDNRSPILRRFNAAVDAALAP